MEIKIRDILLIMIVLLIVYLAIDFTGVFVNKHKISNVIKLNTEKKLQSGGCSSNIFCNPNTTPPQLCPGNISCPSNGCCPKGSPGGCSSNILCNPNSNPPQLCPGNITCPSNGCCPTGSPPAPVPTPPAPVPTPPPPAPVPTPTPPRPTPPAPVPTPPAPVPTPSPKSGQIPGEPCKSNPMSSDGKKLPPEMCKSGVACPPSNQCPPYTPADPSLPLSIAIQNSRNKPITVYIRSTSIPNSIKNYIEKNYKNNEITINDNVIIINNLQPGDNNKFVLSNNEQYLSGVIWTHFTDNKISNIEKGPVAGQVVSEFTINSSNVYYDISAVDGIDGGVKMKYNNNTETVCEPNKPTSDSIEILQEKFNGYNAVLSDKWTISGPGGNITHDPRNFTASHIILPTPEKGISNQDVENMIKNQNPKIPTGSNDLEKLGFIGTKSNIMNSDLQGCPGELANDAIGQHNCRTYYYHKYKDKNSYSSWLENDHCMGYTWAMDEFKCTDSGGICGVGGEGQMSIDEFKQNSSNLSEMLPASSCGYKSMTINGKNYWDGSARGCIDKTVGVSSGKSKQDTNPSPVRNGGTFNITFTNLDWLNPKN
tara:strand:+ start:96 stop:1877 length:1782 start_codon:yes stop_codon:yes gene_type:complete